MRNWGRGSMQRLLGLLWLQLLSRCGGLSLVVHNRDALERLQVGASLNVELGLWEGFASVESVSASRVCFLINGRVCHCFQETYGSAALVLPRRCAEMAASVAALAPRSGSEALYWFAVKLRLPPELDSEAAAPRREVVSGALLVRLADELSSSGSSSSMNSSSSAWRAEVWGAQLSLVLPLALDDLTRAALLLHSLRVVPPFTVRELLVFVPPAHLLLLRSLEGMGTDLGLQFPVHVLDETVLFRGGQGQAQGQGLRGAYPYAVQMGVKLLAARQVQTLYYLTLDADVLALRPPLLRRLLPGYAGVGADAGAQGELGVSAEYAPLRSAAHRALYHFEQRAVHEHWWRGSERLLGVGPWSSYAYARWASQGGQGQGTGQGQGGQQRVQGFGVTPALLSTHGALLTVEAVCSSARTARGGARGVEAGGEEGGYGDGDGDGEWGAEAGAEVEAVDYAQCEAWWLGGFGRPYAYDQTSEGGQQGHEQQDQGGYLGVEVMVWSEYTLYRVVLDHLEVFDELHVAEGAVEVGVQVQVDAELGVEVGVVGAVAGELVGQQGQGQAEGGAGTRLHCFNVWFAEQLPWQAEGAFSDDTCLFSVVQSSTGVAPSKVFSAYRDHFH